MRWLTVGAAMALCLAMTADCGVAKEEEKVVVQRMETAERLPHFYLRAHEKEDEEEDRNDEDEKKHHEKHEHEHEHEHEHKHEHKEEEEDESDSSSGSSEDDEKHEHEADGSDDNTTAPVRSVRFAHKLQKDSESFIMQLKTWTEGVVGEVPDVEPLLGTQFTLTTNGPVDLRRPCGALAIHKTFRVVKEFIDHPDTADLKHGYKLQWQPSRECLYKHNAIEVDGGAHVRFEMRCDNALLLNASIASGGITRKVFWHNVEASGSFVAVELMDGKVKTVGAAGSLEVLSKYRHIPDNLPEVMDSWKKSVHDCAANSKLNIRGVVGGGWRQKFTEWGSLDETPQVSVIGYAEAFDIAYHPKTAAPPTNAPPSTPPVPSPENPVPQPPATTPVPPPSATPVPQTTPPPPPATTPSTPVPPTTTPVPKSKPPTPSPTPSPKTTPPPTDTPVPQTTPAPPPPATPVPKTTAAPTPPKTTTPAPKTTVPQTTPAPPPPAPTTVPPETPLPAPKTTSAPPPPAAPVPVTTPAPPAPARTPAPPPPAATTPAPPPLTTPPAPVPAAATPVNPAVPAGPPLMSLERVSTLDGLKLPAFVTSFDANDLKAMSEAASGIYVQSGIECAADHNETDPCIINHVLPKLTTQDMPDVPMQMTYQEEEDFSSRSLLSMWPLLLLVAVVVAGAIAAFVTYWRRRDYAPIPTTPQP